MTELGYACSYPSFARQVGLAALRPHCEACSGVKAWWRTLSADSPEAAQVSLDRFWATKGDARLRSPRGVEGPPAEGGRPRWPTVGELAEADALLALAVAPYPATIEVTATG